MASNHYSFRTTWQVPATCQDVSDLLAEATELPRWWPSVYLAVEQEHPGDATGVGKRVHLHTRGWLPYTLRWTFVVTYVEKPHGFALRAAGDFVGEGVWTFAQHGRDCIITYDWNVSANKPILRQLSWLLKPIFAANHRWAMARGHESLLFELRRRRGEVVPAPRGPGWWRVRGMPVRRTNESDAARS